MSIHPSNANPVYKQCHNKGPVFNGHIRGSVSTHAGGIVVSNFLPGADGARCKQPRRAPIRAPRKTQPGKSSKQQATQLSHGHTEGTDVTPNRVVDQNNNEGPIFNGTIDGPVSAFDNTFRIEGYEHVPEGAARLLEVFKRSKI